MIEKIRLHLDENVNSALAEGLIKQGIDVTTTLQAGLISASDEAQLAFALQQQRVLFIHDADFLRLHQQGRHHAGIIYSRLGRRSIGEIIDSLVKIWQTQTLESMVNHVEFL